MRERIHISLDERESEETEKSICQVLVSFRVKGDRSELKASHQRDTGAVTAWDEFWRTGCFFIIGSFCVCVFVCVSFFPSCWVEDY